MLPIVLDLKDRICLVVGAGPVGQRKMQAILEAQGTVRLVACSAIEVDPRVEFHQEEYRSSHLTGVSLVFAAATPEVNAQVVRDAAQRGILVSSSSDPDSGDFVLPATHREGDLLVAISTGGSSPSVARWLRDQIAAQLDPNLGTWLAMLRTFREIVATQVPTSDRRQELLRQIADPVWLARLETESAESVYQAMSDLVDREAKR